MALIMTPVGDTEAVVQTNEQLMQVGTCTASLPIDDPLVQMGAFQPWQPVRVRQFDGGAFSDQVYWVTSIDAQGGVVKLSLSDAAVWFGRRALPNVDSDVVVPGQHVLNLLTMLRGALQTYWPAAMSRNDVASGSAGPLADRDETTGILFPINTTAWTITFSVWGISLLSTASISEVRFRLLHKIPAGPATDGHWAPTVEASPDGGTTWLAAHAVPLTIVNGADPTTRDDWFDLTADTTWTVSNLALLQVRVQWVDTVNWANESWEIDEVAVQVVAATPDFAVMPLGLVAGTIELEGQTVQLPVTWKLITDWLSWLVQQSGQEWSVTADPDALTGALLNWQVQLGQPLSLDLTVNGTPISLAGLEEPTTLAGPPETTIDATQMWSAVRVQADGLADVVLIDAATQRQIGYHEQLLNLGQGYTAQMQLQAATDLLSRSIPLPLNFKVVVPRLPGLWSAIHLGDTLLMRVDQAPYVPWQGTVRVAARTVDETQGTLTLSVVAVRDGPLVTQPASLPVAINRPVTSVREDPRQMRDNRFLAGLRLLKSLSGAVRRS